MTDTTLFLAFILMLGIVAAMAIGVAFGRKPISGSCGGLSALGLEAECEICGGDRTRCEESPPRSDADIGATRL